MKSKFKNIKPGLAIMLMTITICFMADFAVYGLKKMGIEVGGGFRVEAQAADYYIDPSGSNTIGNGSATNPWYSLSYACSQVTASGDTIYINTGNYTDNSQCNLALGINIEGAGKDIVTINSNYGGYYIDASSSSLTDGNHEISGFTIKGGSSPDNRQLDYAMRFRRRNNLVIHDTIVRNIECPDVSGGMIIRADITWDADNTVPPDSWLSDVSIYNCEFYDCARHGPGNNNAGALHLLAVQNLELYNCVFDQSNTDGQCIKSVYGWLKGVKIHDNIFRVANESIPRNEHIIIELWNLCEDSEIYNNKFYNGYLSFVSGQKLNGTYSLKFYDNEVYNSPMNEFSIDDVVIYNNYFEGSLGSRWGAGIALWQTWASAKNEIHNWTARNNIFYNSNACVIFISDKENSITLNGVHIYNNIIDGVASVTWGGNGITILGSDGSSYQNFMIKNNIIINCSSAAINKNASIDPYEVSHNFFDADSPEITGSGDVPDPYYRPSGPTANIVDAGVDVGLPYSGSAPDIGAYYFLIIIL